MFQISLRTQLASVSTLFICFFLSAARAEITAEHVRTWVDPSLSEAQIAKLVALVNQEVPLPIIKKDPSENRHFGLSFPGLNLAQIRCLEEIQSRSRASGAKTRVSVLDVGAGHGLMTWKLLVAGAQVTAVELQEPTAQLLIENALPKAREFLLLGETIKATSNVILGDILKFSPEKYANRFEIIWSGNNLHFFNPSQVKDYVKLLFSILKPGGRVFLTALSVPSELPALIDTYAQAVDSGAEFPGFIATQHVLAGGGDAQICPWNPEKRRRHTQ